MNGGFKPTFFFFVNLFLSVLRKARFPRAQHYTCLLLFHFVLSVFWGGRVFFVYFVTRKSDKIKTLIIERRRAGVCRIMTAESAYNAKEERNKGVYICIKKKKKNRRQ